MILVLVRHGKAEAGEVGTVDADRRLTGRGEAQAVFAGRWIAERFAAWAVDGPVRVVSSPAVRTAATAGLVYGELAAAGVDGLVEGVVEDFRLFTSGSVETFAAAACEAAWAGEGLLIAVGHNPTIGVLAGMLAGSDGSMRTGEVVAVRVRGVDGAVVRDGAAEAVLGRGRLD